tara:strand:- start:95 stop:544 length:450 start_codon:yes stop_codon:yes gene_type:complete
MGSIQEEWLIYFHPARTQRYSKWTKWWCRKPNFGHCGALQYIPEKKIWIDLQGTHDGIQVLILTPEEATDKLSYLHPYEILICPVKQDWHFTNLNLLSCVTFMMKLIGFYKWWIITPYQLYCALLNAGYKPFWNKSNKGNNNGKKKTDS